MFFFAVVGLWMTPSHAFSPPPSGAHSPLVPQGAMTWKNAHHHRIANGSNQCKRKTYRNMLPSISIPSISTIIPQNPTFAIPTHFILTNIIYILRRSQIRNMSKRKLLQIRLTREDGVSLRLHATNIFVWQLFVIFIFPFLEPMSRLFGYVSFYYFYPNASGLGTFLMIYHSFILIDNFRSSFSFSFFFTGIIFEPLSAQQLSMSKRTKSQIRCDWHRFSFNVGAVGRDGYRHPPSIERNVPHLDIPKLGWKHWPWRRRCNVERGIK